MNREQIYRRLAWSIALFLVLILILVILFAR